MNTISNINTLHIDNMLYSLGFNPAIRGTKLLNKTIEYIIKNDIEFVTLNNIYKEISKTYGISSQTVKTTINYALATRNLIVGKQNFSTIFNCVYDEYFFEPKILIELLVQRIKET